MKQGAIIALLFSLISAASAAPFKTLRLEAGEQQMAVQLQAELVRE